METIIGDYIGTTIGIHSSIPPFPTKHQTVTASRIPIGSMVVPFRGFIFRIYYGAYG